MNDRGRPTDMGRGWRRGLVARFSLAGGTLGLLLGLCEAALLYFTPRVPTLLQPDVCYVIWFLAPLTGLISLGLLGLALGLVAASGKRASVQRSSTLAALGLGVAGAHVGWPLELVHVWIGDLKAVQDIVTPSVWFAVVFAYALFGLQVWERRPRRFFDLGTAFPLKPLAKGLLAVAVLGVAGVAFFAVNRSSPSVAAEVSAPHPAGRPNIVLITLDTVRADHLSAYGYSRPTTPHLDELADRGVLFENVVAPSSWTLPSHASILTGLLPHQHGANFSLPMDTAAWTLAEVLKAQGYSTAGFTSNIGYGLAGWGMGQGFDVYEDDSSSLRHNLAVTLAGRVIVQPLSMGVWRYGLLDRRDARQVNQDVYRWYRRRSARPFFLFINYFDPHDPYLPPAPYNKRFGRVSEDLLRQVSFGNGGRLRRSLSAEERAAVIAGYDNCLAFLDDQVGKLTRFLAASPGWSNTVVIITSDHGEAFGEHGPYGHGYNLYREVLHVPLIIFGPGIPAGRRIADLASLEQLFPTVIDLALVERLPFSRASLRRFWTPGLKPESPDALAVAEQTPNPNDPDRPFSISLTTSDWHYLHDSQGHVELYHWPTDPQEKINLAAAPEHQSTLQTLHQRLYERVGLSFRPWHGPEHLFALDHPPSYSFVLDTAYGLKLQANLPPTTLRAGACQAYFVPSTSGPRRPQRAEEELIKSLPYH